MPIAIDGEVLVKVKTSGFGIGKKLNGCTIGLLGNGECLVEGGVLRAVELGDFGGGSLLRLGGGGSRLVAQGNGGDCGDGSAVAGRGVGIGGSVVSNVGGGILGIGGLGSGGSCGGQLVGVHRRGSEGAQRCDQARSDHGSGCARTVHLHFFSF